MINKTQIIVSLTSFPKRINTVNIVIKAMLNQSVKPDKILLYLSNEEFKKEEIPQDLIELQNEIFNIKFCDDLKPHKKYYYVMQEYPDSIIITIDDDIYYPKDLIQKLLNSYKNFPNAVSCLRGHTIKLYDEETFAPYHKWCFEQKILNMPSLLVLPTGVGGILYPPSCLPKCTFDKEKIKAECLFTDDLWLKWMQLKANIPAVLVKEGIKLNYIKNTQEESLYLTNVDNKRNDISWRRIIENDNCLNIINENIIMKLYLEYSKTFIKHTISSSEFNKAIFEYNKIKNSRSYKVGRIITFIPRKIKGCYKCYQENGLKYTLKRIYLHLIGKAR